MVSETLQVKTREDGDPSRAEAIDDALVVPAGLFGALVVRRPRGSDPRNHSLQGSRTRTELPNGLPAGRAIGLPFPENG